MVECHRCGKVIASKNELTTALQGLKVWGYHNECYVEHLRKEPSLLFRSIRLNTHAGKIVCILAPFVGAIIAFSVMLSSLQSRPPLLIMIVWVVVFLIVIVGMPYARYRSYHHFEKPLG
ncbi:MAG: hypothetical protein QF486_02475 [Candidatus Woesearchaeota archaeon]|jgi:hypothetical protein|nr:hypothetical protein [Candidatus Woesearchaeota archaeon]MDP7181418.1 hypothetical protein [Candidatus Woesearchaeota archaeon]MDP7198460.1 hypothetical protein [Candidatus Woesearchaeota archaeon]MDP7466798.1 hypothetical protein [Candidatus Woesearchaeota archaeon]MDP7648023.1 hypothetical protein [Candidatus Woesearchaeota archaeon]